MIELAQDEAVHVEQPRKCLTSRKIRKLKAGDIVTAYQGGSLEHPIKGILLYDAGASLVTETANLLVGSRRYWVQYRFILDLPIVNVFTLDVLK